MADIAPQKTFSFLNKHSAGDNMTMLTFPPELILLIGKSLEQSSISALMRASRYFYCILFPCLYHLASTGSLDGLERAVSGGNTDAVRQFFRAGFKPDLTSPRHRAITLAAAVHGRVTILHMILKRMIHRKTTAKTMAEGSQENLLGTLLSIAAEYGHIGVVRLLIKSGVNLSAAANYIQEALYRAAVGRSGPIMKLLLRTPDGRKLAQDALFENVVVYAAGEDLSLLLILIRAGADVSFHANANWLGRAAFMNAVSRGNLPVVEFFLTSQKIQTEDLLDALGNSALSDPRVLRLLFDYIETVILLQMGSRRQKHILLLAALAIGEKYTAQVLLHDFWPRKDVPLFFPAIQDMLLAAIYSKEIEMVEIVLQVSVGQCDIIPALQYAVSHHLSDIVLHLLPRLSPLSFDWERATLTALKCRNLALAQFLYQQCRERNKSLQDLDYLVIPAAVIGGQDSFDLILQWGIELNSDEPTHRQALKLAVNEGQASITHSFMKAGFDPNYKD